MNKNFLLWVGLSAALSPLAHATVRASNVTYRGAAVVSGVTEEAAATFTFQGNDLLITLQNLSPAPSPGAGQIGPGSILSGLFFDLTGGSRLVPVSATTAGIFDPAACTPGPCAGVTNVGGEWGYAPGSYGSTRGHEGIASAGYVTTGLRQDAGNFNGPNLNGPVSLGGIDFAILSKAWTQSDLNHGAQGQPYDQDRVTFDLSGVGGLGVNDISNVSFQYGTSLTEANIIGSPAPVPEPGTAWFLSLGCSMLAWRVRRRS
ncbi:MAG: XDD4 family exosortase-dependent surface protein [Acidiferrobacteraceae bacterium]